MGLQQVSFLALWPGREEINICFRDSGDGGTSEGASLAITWQDAGGEGGDAGLEPAQELGPQAQGPLVGAPIAPQAEVVLPVHCLDAHDVSAPPLPPQVLVCAARAGCPTALACPLVARGVPAAQRIHRARGGPSPCARAASPAPLLQLLRRLSDFSGSEAKVCAAAVLPHLGLGVQNRAEGAACQRGSSAVSP